MFVLPREPTPFHWWQRQADTSEHHTSPHTVPEQLSQQPRPSSRGAGRSLLTSAVCLEKTLTLSFKDVVFPNHDTIFVSFLPYFSSVTPICSFIPPISPAPSLSFHSVPRAISLRISQTPFPCLDRVPTPESIFFQNKLLQYGTALLTTSELILCAGGINAILFNPLLSCIFCYIWPNRILNNKLP